MYKFGLIGRQIDYSFSKAYFTQKFEEEGLPHTYENFDIETIDEIKNIIKSTDNLRGFNVTIPFKESVIPYLDRLNKKAEKIGAVNTVKVTKQGKLVGYNTDYYGFKKSLEPFLLEAQNKALVLGTGGASKAIAYAFKKLGIPFKFVSRQPNDNSSLSYTDLNPDIVDSHNIIVNCTPLGTSPNFNAKPEIPYTAISTRHLLYDLIYNPAETAFLKEGKKRGAAIYNGLQMLELQAEKAWKIWQ